MALSSFCSSPAGASIVPSLMARSSSCPVCTASIMSSLLSGVPGTRLAGTRPPATWYWLPAVATWRAKAAELGEMSLGRHDEIVARTASSTSGGLIRQYVY
jgi:hypothetical protein